MTSVFTARRAMRSARFALLCSAMFLPMATQAAEANPAAADVADNGQSIVVQGARPIAESEAAALKVQQLSDSLVTVAASDAVGRLPDQNIAQAAGRLPGVAVERDLGHCGQDHHQQGRDARNAGRNRVGQCQCRHALGL